MYAAMLGQEPQDGALQVPSLVWNLNTPGDWSREGALTSSAVFAYMPQEVRKAHTGG